MAISSLVWRVVVLALVLIVLLTQLYSRWEPARQKDPLPDERIDVEETVITTPAPTPASTTSPVSSDWQYDWERDRNTFDLSSGQCDAAFPDLYYEIDRAANHWQGKTITSDMLDLWRYNEGGIRVLIHDSQVRVLYTRGIRRGDFGFRILATLKQIQGAVDGAKGTSEAIPDMEFSIAVDDWPNIPPDNNRVLWSFARQLNNPNHDNAWVIPDFNFWHTFRFSLPFDKVQDQAREHDSPIAEKKPQAVWRGQLWTEPEVRGALLDVTKDEPWADVEEIKWSDKSNILSKEEFCDYAFVINTEGRSWSSRLTQILNCDSLPIVHELKWTAHYYHLLRPNVNYVPVRRDFFDLGERVHQYLRDMEAAQEIADTARTTFRERYTTPAATACYWRKLMHSWSQVAFNPIIYKQKGNGDLRGISLDEFIARKKNSDYPNEQEEAE